MDTSDLAALVAANVLNGGLDGVLSSLLEIGKARLSKDVERECLMVMVRALLSQNGSKELAVSLVALAERNGETIETQNCRASLRGQPAPAVEPPAEPLPRGIEMKLGEALEGDSAARKAMVDFFLKKTRK